MKKTKTKAQKSEFRAKTAIVALMCVVAVCLCSVIGLSAFTDVFSGEREVKAVTLVLSQTEQQDLESQLALAAPLIDTDFKSDETDASQLLMYILPGSDNGLYVGFGYEKAQKQAQADPAMRFKNEQGEYSYYKIACEDIDAILESFDISLDHTVNVKDIYCYDGYYYFSENENVKTSGAAKVSISVSKRIQDGRYYVTCDFSGKEAYVIASKAEDEGKWKICQISSVPLFDRLGIMTSTETKGAFDYESKTQIIEGKTSGGVLYCKYTLTYPVFYGKSAGETQANSFYQNVLSYYQQQSEESDKLYKAYIKAGGDPDKLPIELNYSAKVTYSGESYIGVTNEISESLIALSSGEEGGEASAIIPSSKSVEAYVFDAETGDYVSKDTIIGKDYQLLEQLLYRLYNGYDYSSLFSDDGVNTADVPNDVDGLGEKLYLSASTFCTEGYMFCYVCDEGYRQDVIIPYDVDVFEIKAK